MKYAPRCRGSDIITLKIKFSSAFLQNLLKLSIRLKNPRLSRVVCGDAERRRRVFNYSRSLPKRVQERFDNLSPSQRALPKGSRRQIFDGVMRLRSATTFPCSFAKPGIH